MYFGYKNVTTLLDKWHRRKIYKCDDSNFYMITSQKLRHCKLIFLTVCLLVGFAFFSGVVSASISFNPIPPSNICYNTNEKIDITVSGKLGLTFDGQIACLRSGGSYFDFTVYLMESDSFSSDDIIDSESKSVHRTCTDENDFYVPFSVTLSGVDLNPQFDSTFEDTGTIEVYAKVNSNSKVQGASTFLSDVDKLTNCQCNSANSCCTSSRPTNYYPSGSQPKNINDDYSCSGTNSPTLTSYVVKNDYYCSGSSSIESLSSSDIDTCGICEYCTSGDSSCNPYPSGQLCGTTDCNYKDTLCREYNDVNSMCDGAGSCNSGSCSSYTDKYFGASCGGNSECDGAGTCVDCSSGSKGNICYYADGDQGDVYTTNACGDLDYKFKDCGVDSCNSWYEFMCKGSDVYKTQTCYDRGCDEGGSYYGSAKCFENPSKNEEFVESCANGCSNGKCAASSCTTNSDCGIDGYTAAYCSSGDLKQDYIKYSCVSGKCESKLDHQSIKDCGTAGCSNGQCNSAPPSECTDECSLGEGSCQNGYSRSCGNYDSDSCLEFPVGNGDNYCTYGCSNGFCNDPPSGCTDECTPGSAPICNADGTRIRECITNSDSDSCYEWSILGEICNYGCTSGVCNPAPPASDCDIYYAPWNVRWTGMQDKIANNDVRFLCYNKVIKSCGWDVNPSPIPTQVESNRKQGDTVGSWQCDANNKKWVPAGTIVQPPAPDCKVTKWNQLFTGYNNQLGLNGQNDARFLCSGNRIYECGWELKDTAFAADSANGAVVESWKCDLNNKKWITNSGGGGVDCRVDIWGKKFTGKDDKRSFIEYVDNRFLCSNGKFYDCGWSMNVPQLATKSSDGQVVRSWQCDLNSGWTFIGPRFSDNCQKQMWGATFSGTHYELGFTNSRDKRFLCYDGRFYECNWELDTLDLATPAGNNDIMDAWRCDFNSAMWIKG